MEPLSSLGASLVSKAFTSLWKNVKTDPSWIRRKYEKSDPFNLEAKKYVGYVVERYNSMRIIGMDEPVQLKDIYINVTIASDNNLRHTVLEESHRKSEARAVPAQEAVEKNKKLLLLGRPGAGKTTFLKHLAISSFTKNNKLGLVPVFISLKEWSMSHSPRKLETVVFEEFAVCDLEKVKEFTRQLLKQGKCLVLLDGLDEVTPERESIAIQQIEQFVKDYPNNRFVLSCRSAANAYVFSGFKEIEVADFTQNQIQIFVKKWFDTDRTRAESCLSDLHDPHNTRILNLATNPLLLTLICIAYQENDAFPRNRVDLYQTALEALLRKWDSSRNIRRANAYYKLNVAKKELLLSRLAAAGFERDISFYNKSFYEKHVQAFMKEFEGEADVNVADVMTAIEAQHGIVTAVSESVYRFSHLTFEEYYTARRIVDSLDSGLWRTLLDRHLGEPKWTEVLINVAGLQRDATLFVEEMKAALDRQRNLKVSHLILRASNGVRVERHSPTISTLSALHELVTNAGYYEDDYEFEIEPRFEGELGSVKNQIVAVLKVLTNFYSIEDFDPETTSLMVTQAYRSELKGSFYELEYDDVENLRSYLVSLFTFVSCVCSDATLHATIRSGLIDLLLVDGVPTSPRSDTSGLLFS